MDTEFVQHFFIRGNYFGTTTRPLYWVHNEIQNAPFGMAFFCPICAELWAVCPVEGEATQVETQFCEKHKYGDSYGRWSSGQVWRLDIPGSLWSSYDDQWNAGLSQQVLKRELLLLTNP